MAAVIAVTAVTYDNARKYISLNALKSKGKDRDLNLATLLLMAS